MVVSPVGHDERLDFLNRHPVIPAKLTPQCVLQRPEVRLNTEGELFRLSSVEDEATARIDAPDCSLHLVRRPRVATCMENAVLVLPPIIKIEVDHVLRARLSELTLVEFEEAAATLTAIIKIDVRSPTTTAVERVQWIRELAAAPEPVDVLIHDGDVDLALWVSQDPGDNLHRCVGDPEGIDHRKAWSEGQAGVGQSVELLCQRLVERTTDDFNGSRRELHGEGLKESFEVSRSIFVFLDEHEPDLGSYRLPR